MTTRKTEYDVVFNGGECQNCEENRVDYLEIDENGKVTCLSCGLVYWV